MCCRLNFSVSCTLIIHRQHASPLRAHPVLETSPCFRLVLHWKRLNLGAGRDFATINGRGRTWRGLRRFGTPGAFHRLNQRLEGATSLFAIDRPRWPEHNLLASPLEEQFSYRSECNTPEATFTHAAAVPGLRAALRKVH